MARSTVRGGTSVWQFNWIVFDEARKYVFICLKLETRRTLILPPTVSFLCSKSADEIKSLVEMKRDGFQHKGGDRRDGDSVRHEGAVHGSVARRDGEGDAGIPGRQKQGGIGHRIGFKYFCFLGLECLTVTF